MSLRAPAAALILALAFAGTASLAGEATPPATTLSFDERVAAQKAIEQVYWNHRIWPKDNPGPKPPLSVVMPDDAIRAKVEDDLKKSNALDTWWQRPVTADQLQAEMDRMAKSTRDGATLQELYRALGNDPVAVAETLARPVLVERLIRNWYANDTRVHGALRAKAAAELRTCSRVDCLKSLSGNYHEATWKLTADDWTERRRRLANTFGATAETLPTRRLSRLEETPDAFLVTAVLAQTEGELTVATVVWPKRSFDTWWDAERRAIGAAVAQPGGAFTLSPASPTACANDTWTPTRFEVPDPVADQTAVWTGTEMIVWGGVTTSYLNTGGRYNPSTDSWSATSTGANVPDARARHTAVWTGTEMIVWGGVATDYFNTGGRYNPSTDTWTATSTGTNVPIGRLSHTAVWTGTEMIVWGGYAAGSSGGRYNPASDSWSATSTTNAPVGRELHTAVWTGSAMIVWGGTTNGFDGLNTGGRYNPSTDSWSATSTGASVADARSQHTAVWTGTAMIVWGGTTTGSDGLNTGGRYDPAADSWSATSTTNAPVERRLHTAVWTGTAMIVWGGLDQQGSAVNTGGRYDPSIDSWTTTTAGANVPSTRAVHTAVWTGAEMIVWGGTTTGFDSLNTGGRYNPSTDSWTPTSIGVTVPRARTAHSAVWTGAEMIVWGGADGEEFLNSGGRYDPATDSWFATSIGSNVPLPRARHSALWTGAEMIVWGGDNPFFLNTGGRYNPSTDSWRATSTGANVPSPRYKPGAVWTGTEMIVWGGARDDVSGGRYNPSTDSWLATATDENTPAARESLSAVWTGTEMIVWGGYDGSGDLITGGRYNPSTDRWTPTSVGANVPSPRLLPTAVWTGTEMIVWGGYNDTTYNTGARYDPTTNSWTPTSVGANVPEARAWHSAVWTGQEMIVWAGGGNTGGRYAVAGDTWTPTSIGANVPTPRYQHSAVWTGREMIVWGGSPSLASGGSYCACPAGLILYRDADGDGFGDARRSRPSCDGSIPTGFVADDTDCDDGNASIHPGAAESCNAIDDDCDGTVDNGAGASCDDGDACTTDSCGATGCIHTFCDDANACTADLCDLALGCVASIANLDTTDFSANRVDGRDLVVLADAWNSCPGDASYNPVANLDRGIGSPDACIGDTDFHLFMTTFGRGCP